MLLRKNSIHCAVFAKHIVDGSHSGHQTDLGQEAGDAQNQRPAADGTGQPVVRLSGPDNFHITKIPDCENRSGHLSDLNYLLNTNMENCISFRKGNQ